MGFFTGVKSAASSFFWLWKKDGDVAAASSKNASLQPLASNMRGEAKRTWSVRKCEFDKLRVLRQDEMLSDGKPPQQFFHTSVLTDLNGKVSTIKKIDEIEAQMTMQWWKTDRLDLNGIAAAHTHSKLP